MNKPNILIFMTDQQRADSVYDERCLTPNLDSFREKSLTFTNAFCPSPHCCPSRATFMSGLYPAQHGVWHNVNVTNAISRGLNEGVRLWSEDLADAGYKLSFSGKWHVSAVEEPWDRGWEVFPEGHKDIFVNSSEQAWRWYESMGVKEKGERLPGEIHRTGWADYIHYGNNESPFNDRKFVDNALEIIRNRSENSEPWCQFVGTLGPHDPYRVPQRFLDMYKIEDIELPESFSDDLDKRPNLYKRTRDVFAQLPEDEQREAVRHYLAFCTYEDYLFGEIIEALEAKGQLENTIIMYISDHGDYAGEHGLWCKGLPCFKGAYHIPAIIRWDQGIQNPGRSCEKYVSLADFAPTFLEAAEIDTDREFFGASLIPFFREQEPEEWRDCVYTQTNGNEQYGIQRSVMNQRWKYVYNGFDYDELYDLQNDPHEMKNVIDDDANKDVVRSMCKLMWQMGHKSNDNCLNSYIMVGFAPFGPGIAFE